MRIYWVSRHELSPAQLQAIKELHGHDAEIIHDPVEFGRFDEVTDAAKSQAREVFAKEIEGKPEAMKEKIMEGKLKSYFSEKVLLDQPFIKNPELTIQSLIEGAIQKFGEKIEVTRFVRFSVLNK